MGRRRAKRIEERRVREEITEEVNPLRKWLAPWDLPDCIHGCAGPWESCGGQCTFVCHDPALTVRASVYAYYAYPRYADPG